MRRTATYNPTRKVGNEEVQTSANASIRGVGACERQSIVGSSEASGGGSAETRPSDRSPDSSRRDLKGYGPEAERGEGRRYPALTRVALYARYSSDLQRTESIEDQSLV